CTSATPVCKSFSFCRSEIPSYLHIPQLPKLPWNQWFARKCRLNPFLSAHPKSRGRGRYAAVRARELRFSVPQAALVPAIDRWPAALPRPDPAPAYRNEIRCPVFSADYKLPRILFDRCPVFSGDYTLRGEGAVPRCKNRILPHVWTSLDTRHSSLRRGLRVRYSQSVIPFEPHPWLKNPDRMTLAGRFWPRSLTRLPPPIERYFEVEQGIRLLAHCHWQEEGARRPALVLVHGLEGSSDSRYLLGTAEKAWVAGFHVVRMNQRNCGGTEALAPTLYNSGLSGDYRAVVRALAEADGLEEIF